MLYSMWTNYISNDKQWPSIFGENYAPKKINISHTLLLDKSVVIKLHCPLENTPCPKKWIEKNYNECEFDLTINGVITMEINNFNIHGSIELKIEKTGDDCKIEVTTSNNCKITCEARQVYVSNIKAYNNDGSA
ncbi:hypothetical protein GIW70_16240 [Pseudomonas syringae]|nr:hypothetical protein [Pseudomonas syringae]MCF5069741.1 hypothetical protein [Pseudomonas syringae]